MKKSILIWITCFPYFLFGQRAIFLTGYGGQSFHRPATLVLQFGKYHYKIKDVHFSSRSFEFPLYYGISIGKETATSRFGIELVHDKAFVQTHRFVRVRLSENPLIPSGTRLPFEAFLSRLSISHGCNFLVFKYAHRFFNWKKGFSGHGGIGAGVLIPHIESRDSQEEKAQYEIHFPAGLMDWVFQWKMTKMVSFISGWKITTARISRGHVVGGNVSFWIWALHGIVGVEFHP